MARKGKKRSEERRQRKQRQDERVAAGESAAMEPAGEESSGVSRSEPVEQEVRLARNKRKKKAGPRIRFNGWFIGVPVAIGGVIVFAMLILTSGSSGVTAPKVDATPDPRVEGLTPVQTIEITAGDNFFSPSAINGPVGEPFEIVVANTGTASHNLKLSGVDGTYDTSDDWTTDPFAIAPGEEGTVVVLIETPGTYAFLCTFHASVQTGELTIQ